MDSYLGLLLMGLSLPMVIAGLVRCFTGAPAARLKLRHPMPGTMARHLRAAQGGVLGRSALHALAP